MDKFQNAFLLTGVQRNQLERKVKAPANPNHAGRELSLVLGNVHPENEKEANHKRLEVGFSGTTVPPAEATKARSSRVRLCSRLERANSA